jgi:hypothetical protein
MTNKEGLQQVSVILLSFRGQVGAGTRGRVTRRLLQGEKAFVGATAKVKRQGHEDHAFKSASDPGLSFPNAASPRLPSPGGRLVKTEKERLLQLPVGLGWVSWLRGSRKAPGDSLCRNIKRRGKVWFQNRPQKC